MRDARHFANECMVEYRLKTELESLIPLRERGRLLDALQSINVIARQFQGQSDEVRSHCRVVIEQLRKAKAQARTASAWIKEDPKDLDAMTALSRKEIFHADLASAILQSGENQPLALVLLDIDTFKIINDTNGHSVGDAVLKVVAGQIRRIVDGKGKGYRCGGDEFALLIPNANPAEAISTAERLRQAVEALGIVPEIKVTISAGVVACTDPRMGAESLFSEGDAQLYKSKQGGRNRVSGMAPADKANPEVEVALAPTPQNLLPTLHFGRFPEDSFCFSDPLGDHNLKLPSVEHLHLWLVPSVGTNISSKAAKEAIKKGNLKPMGAELLGAVTERNTVGAFVCLHENETITHLTQLHTS